MRWMNYSDRQIRKIRPLVRKIEEKREVLSVLSDCDLQAKTAEFQSRLAEGVLLDNLLPEAYAVAREASRRVLGLEHYPEQLLGGILLYQGRLAQMQTGEGKTLVALLPAYLVGLEGRGVHVVTVNDYLAKRDAEEIGSVLSFLGLSVGCVTSDASPAERKAAYGCDVTYVTNNEDGFDYLRDNMAASVEGMVQRGLHYAIIDEADSVLIDEARTPLIISGQGTESTALYEQADRLAKQMVPGSGTSLDKLDLLAGETAEETGDFILDEKDKLVQLTEAGVKKVELFFHLDNYADMANLAIQHHMQIALKARYLMTRDKDYVVTSDGEVAIVDEFTGRILPGRRYSDGLHQAIEAKEAVAIRQESKTLATITFQNFFNLYDRKAGMTGTAITEADEFREIYGLDVVEVPTHRPVIRKDLDDLVYLTKEAKYAAVTDAVAKAHVNGQPVLVGTVTIDVSERLSKQFSRRGIPHEVLNAKQNEREAEIISHAGEAGAVTIATNMAGRGTDIKLDDAARAAGGLLVIGTQRHESRRIDLQLRGRSGRQGDPGCSQFYLSLEDDLFRLFGSEQMIQKFTEAADGPDAPISHRMLTRAIENAQKQIEGNHFGARKTLMKYDAVNHEQREWVYAQRRSVLEKADLREEILSMGDTLLERLVATYCSGSKAVDWNMDGFALAYRTLSPGMQRVRVPEDMTSQQFLSVLREDFRRRYQMQADMFGEERWEKLERNALLLSIDRRWMQQLEDLAFLRQSVGMVSFGQKDPVTEYELGAYRLFSDMVQEICQTTISLLMLARLAPEEESISVRAVG